MSGYNIYNLRNLNSHGHKILEKVTFILVFWRRIKIQLAKFQLGSFHGHGEITLWTHAKLDKNPCIGIKQRRHKMQKKSNKL
jgi:hypothetical protein